MIDEVIAVSDEDALAAARAAAEREGLLVGISAGAAFHAALELAARPEMDGKRIVTIACDGGERYMSLPFFSAELPMLGLGHIAPRRPRDRLRRRLRARPRPGGPRGRHGRDPLELGRGAGAARPPRLRTRCTTPACRWRRGRSRSRAARSPGSRSIRRRGSAQDFFIDHGSGVVIGETAEIGDRVTLYQGVTLGGTGFARGKRHPTVRDDVTIGSGAKLLGPVTVGHGAKIGANTVVIEDVPANSTVVGNPGHPVRVEGRRPEGPDADWIHLPDPVADAIKALSERIGALEERLGELDGKRRRGRGQAAAHQAGAELRRRVGGHRPTRRARGLSSPR